MTGQLSYETDTKTLGSLSYLKLGLPALFCIYPEHMNWTCRGGTQEKHFVSRQSLTESVCTSVKQAKKINTLKQA